MSRRTRSGIFFVNKAPGGRSRCVGKEDSVGVSPESYFHGALELLLHIFIKWQTGNRKARNRCRALSIQPENQAAMPCGFFLREVVERNRQNRGICCKQMIPQR